MIVTMLSIDNKDFYIMLGKQKPVTIARYANKNKLKCYNESEKDLLLKDLAIKNKGLIVTELIGQSVK